jgi:hypothetical protein
VIFLWAIFKISNIQGDFLRLSIFLAIALHPLILINSSNLHETSQSLCFFGLSLLATQGYLKSDSKLTLILLGASVALTVLVRPDNAIFAILLSLCLMYELRKTRRRMFELSGVMLIYGFLVVSTYFYLNSGFDFIFFLKQFEQLPKRVLRATAGFLSVFTPIGLLIIFYLWTSFLIQKKRISELPWDKFLIRFALVLIPVYVLRYIFVADQLEYIIFLYVVVMIATPLISQNRVLILALVGSLLLSNLVQISFLRKVESNIFFEPKINMGALFQDWRIRKFNLIRETDEFRDFISKSSFKSSGSFSPQLTDLIFFAALVSDGGDLVIQRESLFLLDNPVQPGMLFQRKTYNKIIVCDENLELQRSWRRLMPPDDDKAIKKYRSQELLNCHDESVSIR